MGAAVRVVRKSQNGYVLLMVLGVLAVMAFVIGRFAERNDQLRRNALDLTQYGRPSGCIERACGNLVLECNAPADAVRTW